MSEHTPLTEAERIERLLVDHEYLLQYRSGGICTCGFVPTVEANSLKTQQDYHRAHIAAVLAARTSAATADTDPHALSEAEERELRAERRGYLIGKQEAAAADTGHRERVRVGFRYQDGEILSPEREAESADEEVPVVVLDLGEGEWLTLADLRAAAPTTDTGARDE